MTTFTFNGCKFTEDLKLEEKPYSGLYDQNEQQVKYMFYPDFWLEHLEIVTGIGYKLGNIHVVLHEYVHYLQHREGDFKEMVLLDIPAPITSFIKENYPESAWALEAQAFWLQNKWWKFMEEEELQELINLLNS